MGDATGGRSGTLPGAMLIAASSSNALGQTIALLITFGGIGVLVTALVGYIIAQVMAEHRQNQEYDQRT
jgi:ABC-type nitrate/sulfonate/bicarbonate transport system permease component